MSKIAICLQLTGLDKDKRFLLESTSERCAIVCNEWVTIWHQWHRENGSGEKLAEWMASLRDWHRADKEGRGEKPKCPVAFDNPEIREQWRELAQAHFRTNSRVVTLLRQWLRKKLTTSHSGLSEWIEVLLNRRRSPQFIGDVPIPVDRKNLKLSIEHDPDYGEQLRLQVRIDRVERDGSVATSTPLQFGLKASGKRRRYAEPVWQAVQSGEKHPPARIYYRQSCNKWFAAFTVDAPETEEAELDPELTAVVMPGWSCPFLIRRPRGSVRHGYRAAHVGHMRRKIINQRLSRQNYYRLGPGGSRKGAGRGRALQPWEGRLSLKWRAFGKRCNQGWSHDLAERIASMGIGRVVLVQPTDGRRFLDTTGAVVSAGQSGWNWTEWLSEAKRKLTRKGVKVVDVKDSAGRKSAKRKSGKAVA